jgi:hypothetical protein
MEIQTDGVLKSLPFFPPHICIKWRGEKGDNRKFELLLEK